MARLIMHDRLLPNLLAASGIGLLVGVAALRFSPALALGGLLGVMFLIGIARRPEFGLLGIIFITGGLYDFVLLPFLKLGPISFHLSDILLMYLLALILIKILILKDFKVVRTPLDIPLLCFILAAVLSAFISIADPSMETNWVLRRLRPLMYYLGFFAVTNLIREKKQLTVLINGLFIIAMLSCLAYIFLNFAPFIGFGGARELKTAGREYEDVIRIASWTGGHLIYIMFLVSVCSLIFRGKWLPSAVEFVRAGVLGFCIFLSFERNMWLTMISMLALLGLLVSRAARFRILRWTIAVVILVTLLANLPAVSPTKYLTAAYDRLFWGMQLNTLVKDDSTQWRVLETRYAIQSIVQQPLLGIGLGNFYRPAFENDPLWYPDKPNTGLRWYIHNAYLWVWIDMGLLGVIPFIWVFASFLVRGFRRWRNIEDPKLRSIALGFTLACLGMVISNLVAPYFVSNWSLSVFAVILGINELIFVQSDGISKSKKKSMQDV